MTDRRFRLTKQCASCPWRKDVDPTDLGGDLGRVVPERAREHTAVAEKSLTTPRASCHLTTDADPSACVGWLAAGLRDGNFRVRIDAMRGRFDPDALGTVGEQRSAVELLRTCGDEGAESCPSCGLDRSTNWPGYLVCQRPFEHDDDGIRP